MVKITPAGNPYEDEANALADLVKRLCDEHGLTYHVTGWTRVTYEVYAAHDPAGRHKYGVACVESLATRDGRVLCKHADGMPFCRALAEALEARFEIEEAEIIWDEAAH